VKGRTELPGIVDEAMSGKLDIEPYITHRLPLAKINEAFDLMHGQSTFFASASACAEPVSCRTAPYAVRWLASPARR
jgi:hypothetical protein